MKAYTAYLRAIKLLIEDAVVHLNQEERDHFLAVIKIEIENRLRQGVHG